MLRLNQRSFVLFISALLFTAMLAINFIVHKDYGISVDEQAESLTGMVNAKQIAKTFNIFPFLQSSTPFIPSPAQHENSFYGAGLQIPITMYEVAKGHVPNAAFWFNRHFYTNIIFSFGVMAFFLLCHELFNSIGLALLAAILLYSHPRIFAESYYNIKDIGFLSSFVIAQYASLRFYEQPSWRRTLLCALTLGFACSVRIGAGIIGIVLFPFYLAKPDGLGLKSLLSFLALTVLTAFFLVLFYPASWGYPGGFFLYFLDVIKKMSHYPWAGDVFYLGKTGIATQLPWHYLPTWMFVSTPLPVVVPSLFGVWHLAFLQAAQNSERIKKIFLITLQSLALFPVVILLSSTVYDGWRQFYFMYPGMVILAVYGIRSYFQMIRSIKFLPEASGLVLVLLFLSQLSYMRDLHPFQNVFFNEIARPVAAQAFELDYWGLSERKAFEKLLELKPDGQISYELNKPFYPFALDLLAAGQRQRLVERQQNQSDSTAASSECWYRIHIYRHYSPPSDSTSVLYAEKAGEIPLYRIEQHCPSPVTDKGQEPASPAQETGPNEGEGS